MTQSTPEWRAANPANATAPTKSLEPPITRKQIKLPKRSLDITHYKLTGEPEYFVGQKHIDIFGKHIKYGKPRYATNVNLGLGTGKPSTAPGTYTPPNLGYKSVGGRPISIFDAKMTAPTPKEWIRMDWLSTTYHPKPVVKGTYQWRFGVIDYTPYVTSKLSTMFGKNIYKTVPDIISKPKGKIIDMGKVFGSKETTLDNIFKDTGGVSSGGTKQQTIQLLKTKSITEQVLKTESLTEQVSKSKSLTEQKSEMAALLAKASVFAPMYKSKLDTALIFAPMYDTKTAYATLQAQEQQSGLVFAPMYKLKSDYDTVNIFGQNSISDIKFDTVTETTYNPTKPYIPSYNPPIFIPKQKIPKLPHFKQPIFKSPSGTQMFKIPEFFAHKKKKQVNPFKKYSSGYRFRTWKVPSMKDFLKGGL